MPRSLFQLASSNSTAARAPLGPARRWQPLPGCEDWSARIRQSEALFSLDRDATELCAHLATAGAHTLARCLEAVRLPATDFWLEWPEAPRRALQAEHAGGANASAHKARIVGVHVTCDETQRRGELRSFWADPADRRASCSPFVTEFDLDAPAAEYRHGPFPRRYEARNSRFAPEIVRHASFVMTDAWHRYYAQRFPREPDYRMAATRLIAAVASDLPMVIAFATLLMARGARGAEAAHLGNQSRHSDGRRRPQLASVSLDLLGMGAGDESERAGAGSGHARRLHFVRGHPVRRGSLIYWRSPHLRGRAELGSSPAPLRRVRVGRTQHQQGGVA